MLVSNLWPGAAALAAMPYGALAGAAAGLGIVILRWHVKPGMSGDVEPRRFIPGEPRPDNLPAEPWGPAGIYGAFLGALVGAGLICVWTVPRDSMGQAGLLFAMIGLTAPVRRVLQVLRDKPVVGEAPPEDAEQSPPVRLRHAWESLALAAVGLLLAAFGVGWI